jgi:hypothetical protein
LEDSFIILCIKSPKHGIWARRKIKVRDGTIEFSVFGDILQATVVHFTFFNNISWQVEVATEIFVSAENITD